MSCWMSQRRSCPNERGKRVASGSFRRIAPPGPAPFFSFSFFASNLSFSGEIFASFVSMETPFSVVGGIETLSRCGQGPVHLNRLALERHGNPPDVFPRGHVAESLHDLRRTVGLGGQRLERAGSEVVADLLHDREQALRP